MASPQNPMGAQKAIVTSARWTAESASFLEGLELDGAPRSRIAGTWFHLSREHQQAIHVLGAHGLIGSARTLLRPQFEAYIRGMWAYRCASENWVANFSTKGTEPPTIGLMLEHLRKAKDFNADSLIATKEKVLGVLHDFTHGGRAQIRDRITTDEIKGNYTDDHLVGLLRWSAILSYMGDLGIADLALARDLGAELANKLRALFLSLYADGWNDIPPIENC